MILTTEDCQQKLQDLLEAKFPLIFLRSSEENRAMDCVIVAHKTIISNLKLNEGELARWSSLEGFYQASFPSEAPKFIDWKKNKSSINNTQQTLKFLGQQLETASQKLNQQFTYLLPDWAGFIEGTSSESYIIARQLRELTISIEERYPRPRMTIIILGSSWSIPPILRNHVQIVDLSLPRATELYPIFSEVIPKHGNSDPADELSKQAQGMPLQAAKQVAELIKVKKLGSNLEETKKLLLEVKQQEIRKTGVLEYYSPQGNGLDDVGGLDNLKTWIKERKKWFLQNEMPKLRPRAILLEGFPGCGKSFIARAIAQQWNVPQINFEISRLKSKWVGETESNTFQALRAIEASAPNILFIDEIEKIFAGVGREDNSDTTTSHQFGTFLSWLNDHEYPIFLIVTSNNTEALPQELFRAGRFDKRFLFLPPTTQERRQILEKRIKAHGLEACEDSILDELVQKTCKFSGAEIDQLVKEAIYLRDPQELKSVSPMKQPTIEQWNIALTQIHPQIQTPAVKKLLEKYVGQFKAGAESASQPDGNFWEELIKEEKSDRSIIE